MKRAYRQADELGKQRAIGKFRELAAEGASVPLALPLAEVMQMVQDGCGQWLREAGLRLMMLVREEEAERLVGPRHQQDEQRRGYRWGNEAGYCVVDGQKVPIDRIRLRRKEGRELPAGELSIISTQHTAGGWGVVEDDAGVDDAQLWGGDEDFSPGLRS